MLRKLNPVRRIQELVRELRQARQERNQARRQAAPEQCPDCGGPRTVERVELQYQEEILRRTWVRRFHIPICRCAQCAKRVQGRRPLQASDALGAAAVQVGPEAVTLGVLMNKSLGLPHAGAATVLQHGFGLTMSRGGICRAIQRVARKAEATWHALRDAARRSALAHLDETGWKVEAQWRWLWAVVTEQLASCEILQAAHQSCAAHLIRRCRDLATVATPAAARFPLAVKQLLEQGLSLRDRYLEHKISLQGLWTATGLMEAKLDRLLARHYRDRANQRLAKHLRHERPCLFTFLYCPGLADATNNLAERVMRQVAAASQSGSTAGDRAVKAPEPAGDSVAEMRFPDLGDVLVLPDWRPSAATAPLFSSA